MITGIISFINRSPILSGPGEWICCYMQSINYIVNFSSWNRSTKHVNFRRYRQVRFMSINYWIVGVVLEILSNNAKIVIKWFRYSLKIWRTFIVNQEFTYRVFILRFSKRRNWSQILPELFNRIGFDIRYVKTPSGRKFSFWWVDLRVLKQCALLCPGPHRVEALSDDARLTSVCLSDLCLSVAYIGPKSRRLKLGQR